MRLPGNISGESFSTISFLKYLISQGKQRTKSQTQGVGQIVKRKSNSAGKKLPKLFLIFHILVLSCVQTHCRLSKMQT
jgi:hypothetical protein